MRSRALLTTPGVLLLKRLALLLALTLPVAAQGEVRLPHMLSDHAVLQRDRPIHLWGWSTPGTHLSAHFHDQTVAAVTGDLGKWSLWLHPESMAPRKP